MSVEAVPGIALALVCGALIVLALRVAWRQPFLGLGVLVAGMAVHNLAIMALVRLDTPAPLIRGVQAWKEVLLIVLVGIAVRHVARRWREGWRPGLIPLDWIAIAFTAFVIGYASLQLVTGTGDATFAQRLVSVRLLLLPPLLYALGRSLLPTSDESLRRTCLVIVGAASVVGVFGLWELWFVPSAHWIDWGAIGFSEWLGYDYEGPAGLPPNFFQSLSGGLALRRMVSTYISPLGIAYTGLLVVPLAAALAYAPRLGRLPRWAGWTMLVVVTAGVLFSVTRLALLVLAAEFILLAILLRARRTIVTAAVVVVAVVAILYAYPRIGPVMTYDLVEVSSPTSFLRTPTEESPPPDGTGNGESGDGGELIDRVLSAEDTSVQGHLRAITSGIAYIATHPLGTGPGSAVPRYGETDGPGESAVLRIGGEMGILGAVVYLAMYAGAVVVGWIAFRRATSSRLRVFSLVPLVGGLALIPVMLTSDVWGNFSVTFLFWWCAGLSASVAAGRRSTELDQDPFQGLAGAPSGAPGPSVLR